MKKLLTISAVIAAITLSAGHFLYQPGGLSSLSETLFTSQIVQKKAVETTTGEFVSTAKTATAVSSTTNTDKKSEATISKDISKTTSKTTGKTTGKTEVKIDVREYNSSKSISQYSTLTACDMVKTATEKPSCKTY